MAFSSYSTTPDNNTSINGTNIAENCPAGNVNNAIRQIMADGAELAATVAAIDTSTGLPLTGGEVTGVITRGGAGAHLYHVGPTLLSGAVHAQPLSQALPTGAEGVIVLQWA